MNEVQKLVADLKAAYAKSNSTVITVLAAVQTHPILLGAVFAAGVVLGLVL